MFFKKKESGYESNKEEKKNGSFVIINVVG